MGEYLLEVYFPGVEFGSTLGEMACVLTDELLVRGEDRHLTVVTNQRRSEQIDVLVMPFCLHLVVEADEIGLDLNGLLEVVWAMPVLVEDAVALTETLGANPPYLCAGFEARPDVVGDGMLPVVNEDVVGLSDPFDFFF